MENNSTSLPSALVASALVLLLALVTVTAIVKYDTVEEALQIWSSLSSIVGVVTGVVVTYFFKQSEVKAAEARAAVASKTALEISTEAHVVLGLLSHEAPHAWYELQKNPVVRAFIDRVSAIRSNPGAFHLS